MPCDQRVSIALDVAKMDGAIYDAAMKTLGYTKHPWGAHTKQDGLLNVTFVNGKLVVSGTRAMTTADATKIRDQIAQGYSKQVVMTVAAKLRWVVAPVKVSAPDGRVTLHVKPRG